MSLPVAEWRTVIAEVLEGAIGSTRTLTAAKYLRGVFEGQPEQAQKALAIQTTAGRHRFDVRVRRVASHSATYGQHHSGRILAVDVEILVTSALATVAQRTQRETDVALVLADCELAVEALGYPGNLRVTDAGAPTYILGACMRGGEGASAPRILPGKQDWERQLMTTVIAGQLLVAPLTTVTGGIVQDGTNYQIVQDGTGSAVIRA